jgi:hypothetical protein
MMRWLVVAALALGGCGGSKSSSNYVGSVKETGKVEESGPPGTPGGAVNVQEWKTERPASSVKATVTPTGDNKLRVTVAQLNLEFEKASGNIWNAVLQPEPSSCAVDIDHFKGNMTCVATLTIDDAAHTIKLIATANNNRLTPHVEWSLTYEGKAE